MGLKNNSQKTGFSAEEEARTFLKNAGYKILCSNFRYRKYEIDIIAENANCIVFVEVKARSGETFGDPAEFVNRKKQGFIVSAANFYLQKHAITKEARFDIVSVLMINNTATVKHLPDAWYAAIK